MHKLPWYALVSLGVLTLGAQLASAHVVVKPAQVGVAAFQTFNVSVPVEKDVSTTALRLTVPAGLKYVTPTVKPGWTIATKKEGDAVTEISWTGGLVPAGQRDDFSFSAQAPATATDLLWKAYQTYQDGSVVSWDQVPAGDDESVTPYSITHVINDLAPAAVENQPWYLSATPFWMGTLALIVAVAGLVVPLRRR